MSDFSIPRRVSVEDINDILKAYYIEGAHEEPVSTGPVEDTSDLGDRVGRQTKFLVDLGLLEKKGRDRALTNDGEDISEALMAGNESLARNLFREVLNEWGLTEKVLGFVRMNDPDAVEKDRLMEYIGANADSNDNRGRRALIDLYVWVRFLEETEDGYIIADGPTEETRDVPQNNREKDVDERSGENREVNDQQQSENLAISYSETDGERNAHPYSINIEITPEDNPDEITDVIKAVRRGLEQDLEDIDD